MSIKKKCAFKFVFFNEKQIQACNTYVQHFEVSHTILAKNNK